MRALDKVYKIATVGFNATTEDLFDEIFETPRYVISLQLIGDLWTGDETRVYVNSEKEKLFFGIFKHLVGKRVKFLKVTPNYATARAGLLIIRYLGTDIKSRLVGTSIALPTGLVIIE